MLISEARIKAMVITSGTFSFYHPNNRIKANLKNFNYMVASIIFLNCFKCLHEGNNRKKSINLFFKDTLSSYC